MERSKYRQIDDNYVKYMKRCYELAISAGKKGYDTYSSHHAPLSLLRMEKEL